MSNIIKHRHQPTFVSTDVYDKIFRRLNYVDIFLDDSATIMAFDRDVIRSMIRGIAGLLIDCPTLEECE